MNVELWDRVMNLIGRGRNRSWPVLRNYPDVSLEKGRSYVASIGY
jgi:hypothetical protein